MGFVPTWQTEEAKKLLQDRRSVVIKGNPGEGKTSTALHLIDNDDYRNQRVVINSPKDWKKVDTDWVNIVVLENIFGQYDVNSELLQEWIDSYLQTIQYHVDVGKLLVIITIRDDIMLKVNSNLSSFKLFFSDMSLTLSSIKLKSSEKMSILSEILKRNNIDMNVDMKQICIDNFSGLIGFPQCCYLFAFHKDLFNYGPRFFKSPNKFLVENIRNLKANSFLSLAFLFCNGEIEEEYMSTSQIEKSETYLPVLEELAKYLNISFNESTMISLRESFDHFSRLYVSKLLSHAHHSRVNIRKSSIRFSHATVYEAVGQVLGDMYPEMVVKYGDPEYLYQRTYTAEAKNGASLNVFIPVYVYELLVERIIHDVVEKQLAQRVLNHSALKEHKLLMTLKDKLRKSNRIRDFLTAKTLYVHESFSEDLSEGECITFLQYVLQVDDVVRLVYSHFVEFLACAHTNMNPNCWQCSEKQNLLELALYYNHSDIADELLTMNACYTYVSLCNAARHGDLTRVQAILAHLKRRFVFIPENIMTKKALCRAYVSDNQDVIYILTQEGITLDREHIVDAVQHGDLNVLMKVVEHLKYHNRWDLHLEQSKACRHFFPPDMYSGKFRHYNEHHNNPLIQIISIPYSTAVCITYCNEKFDMAAYLLENEAKVSLRMLMYVSGYSSQQAVASIIQNLKVNGTWDPHCDDASKALLRAYTEQKYDVCDQLVQAGVSLTMKHLSVDLMGFQISLESIKKAIQHLKDTDSWDPKCDDASKALEKAYGTNKYDVCDLLCQQEVSLTMANLLVVVWRYQASLESVKKAIQHLKHTDNWHPKCNIGSKALEKAYGHHMNDVCALLIQEGVSLTMRNFCGVVKNIIVSLEPVTRAIQHLKDTNSWNPKCYYASTALENAFRQYKNGVCDLLIQEGVSLTMKNFHGVVNDALESLESVKKAIQHLKDTDSWDPNCYYASKALGKAYCQQKYDIYDLLIFEGITLKMKNLPVVVSTLQVSLKYVEKAIQYLKDNGIWDHKCNDASEALERAFGLHKYNVCKLLIQERVSLKMKNLANIVMESRVSFKSINKAIQHLKDTDNWNPKCTHASKALSTAYSQQRHDVCDLLIQEGVSLTMKNIPCVISTFGESLDSDIRTIQHFKGTGTWDPKCDDASKALEIAFGSHKYDVCNLLVHEGVSLTMKNLSGLVCTSQVSLESVKKVIQH